ncbi:MAG: hypothetical protein ASARMPRED_004662 [Alectoria sarmentosa]|nr:MAG: hypothetical protein ASARMPRED_004662 [Alectoria sarmentosa]
MAKEFLSKLLKLENIVQSDDRQRCMICLEEIGSLSSQTGIIECQIRLPCDHLVGSHCIATWLHDNNTCPACRRPFFTAQPRPYLEHGIIQDGEGSDGDGESDESDLDDQDRTTRLASNTMRSCYRLGLNYAACRLALLIARRSFHMDALRDYSQWSKAAVSIFAASHLVRRPVTLEQVSTVMEISQRTILDAYRRFYPERETAIDRECLFLLREDPQHATRGDRPTLVWPPPRYEGESHTDALWQS